MGRAGSRRHHLRPSFVLAAERPLRRCDPLGLVLGVQMRFQMSSAIVKSGIYSVMGVSSPTSPLSTSCMTAAVE